MKLIYLQLCNFRQFYGKTPAMLLAATTRNTTIIHGNNGAGKTTLLNAFTWVLYEKFSPAFAAEEQLVNKRALSEIESRKPVECWVELVFEHHGKRYQAKRLCRAYKTESGVEQGASELSMYVAGDDGRWVIPPQPPEDIIGRILPESLHQYFFFDGERIDKIVRPDKKAEIAAATKELLGVEVFNRGIRHLGEAKKSLENDLMGIGNLETKKLLADKRKREEEVEKISARLEEIAGELASLGEVKKSINQRFLELGGAGELQKRRQTLEGQEKSLREQLKQGRSGLQGAVASRGYTVLLSEAVAEFRGMFENLRSGMPAGIKQPFVRELLERQVCICGGELHEGTHAYHLVQEWMEKAGDADIEETALLMRGRMDEIDKQVPEFWREIDGIQQSIQQFRADLSGVETQLDDIKDNLRRYPDEDIQQLQQRLDEIEGKIEALNRETGSHQQQLDSLKQEISRLGKDIDKQQMNEMRQVLAQKRIAATEDAIARLTEVRSRLESQFRAQLEQRVQQIFYQISFTPYIPKLNDSYELNLVENTSGRELPVAASTGENQILSLSFIGGIMEAVREWSKKNTLMGPDSSNFPIVMDSAFGSLDEVYRRQIAKTIPKLANQLLVLVTKTQWRGEVAAEMADFIGREYVLVYNSPKPDCEEDVIELGNGIYPLVRRSPNEFEYTEIIQVERDS
ncbi:MAG TPA: AAA family ATPase [Oscillatoriaceae cyanobacterium M33_DOE_052]|uniref:Nuclease SbcCD subunit C n=1 Tax=Planktothricoides sp. SpSt-374 TaxID=2282167 RepID=A0A7C3VMR2_9CYAN|nr:AAA family ATPase [Oscillatoriaceae cyanobacterium M33_DOE_052]